MCVSSFIMLLTRSLMTLGMPQYGMYCFEALSRVQQNELDIVTVFFVLIQIHNIYVNYGYTGIDDNCDIEKQSILYMNINIPFLT